MDPDQPEHQDDKTAGKRKKRDWQWLPADMAWSLILPFIIVLILMLIVLALSSL